MLQSVTLAFEGWGWAFTGLAGFAAYTLSKYAMSVWVLGMSAEFADRGVAFNALWPRTAVATAAVRNLLGGEKTVNASRTPAIVGALFVSWLTEFFARRWS